MFKRIIESERYPRNLAFFWIGVSVFIALATPNDVLRYESVKEFVDFIGGFYPPAGDHYAYSERGDAVRFYYAVMLVMIPLVIWSLFFVSDEFLSRYIKFHKMKFYQAALFFMAFLPLATVFGFIAVHDSDSAGWNRYIVENREALGIMGAINLLGLPYFFRCFIFWVRYRSMH